MMWLISVIAAAQVSASEIQFAKKNIVVGTKAVVVELAHTDRERARGLMFRQKLESDSGMLFLFETEEIQSFWMKNTFIPLSIAFISKNKTIVDIQDMDPVSSEMQKEIPSYKSKRPAQYALEMNRGWFKKNKIKVGDKVQF